MFALSIIFFTFYARLYSASSLIRIIDTGIAQILISTDITAKYPFWYPHAGSVAPTISYPIALPAEPVPSIIPVIVDIALSFPLRAVYFPRSAAHTEEIILLSELMKNP